MILLVPFQPSIPSYRFATVLADTRYIFDVHWNGRENAWYFDLLTEDEEPIVSGVKIILGIPLGWRAVSSLFPQGLLLARDSSGNGIDAGFDDLGVRVNVYFYDVDELQALEAASA